MRELWAVVSDLHCGSTLGLCPPEGVQLDDGGQYLPSAAQKALWDVRKAGLNIMMSLKGDGKPVSFIEDCAVPLEHLAEYTDALERAQGRAAEALIEGGRS